VKRTFRKIFSGKDTHTNTQKKILVVVLMIVCLVFYSMPLIVERRLVW